MRPILALFTVGRMPRQLDESHPATGRKREADTCRFNRADYYLDTRVALKGVDVALASLHVVLPENRYGCREVTLKFLLYLLKVSK